MPSTLKVKTDLEMVEGKIESHHYWIGKINCEIHMLNNLKIWHEDCIKELEKTKGMVLDDANIEQ